MRRFLVVGVLPLMFGLVPALAGAAVVAALPPVALEDYLMRIRTSPIDWLILGLGATLFLAQTLLAVRAMRWRETGFNEGPDRWLAYLAQGAEWFPLLGLLGTVAGILQTFSSINGPVTPQEIIRKYAPAITATGSGLFMALLNILPTWVVNVGRDLILALAGGPSSRGE
ncbi:MAG: MotA/TolQ/ExbB proton channel family protein [Gemmataceae bacterium]|nr:MotA/TolQ/ExbB proton channel family protein [Gemmataceae bacterium]